MATNPRLMADALYQAILGHSWSISSLSIERRNWVQASVTELSTPALYVVPGGVDVSRIGRIDWQYDSAVNVFVGRHVETDSQVDDMYDLIDDLMAFIRATPLTGVTTSPQQVTVEINADDTLSERNVWKAVLTVTYRNLSSDS